MPLRDGYEDADDWRIAGVWGVRLLTWFLILWYGDNVLSWFWSFLRYVAPGAVPQ